MASLVYSFSVACIVAMLSDIFSCTCANNVGGFTLEMIHRDSPSSPFYNPNDTPFDRLANAFSRSMSRASYHHTMSTKSTPQPLVISNGGEYLVNISIGTPPFQILGTLDTGSDLIWTQCIPCKNCYKQLAPLFNPKSSATYKNIPCASRACKHAGGICDKIGKCIYSVAYGDGSYSNGNIAFDSLTLRSSTPGSVVSVPNTLFGCGHDDEGIFTENNEGVIGLGRGEFSLISQLGALTTGKFSYCLVKFSVTDSSSKLSFGTDAIVSGDDVVSTPLKQIKSDPGFYSLLLEAISVGDTRIENPDIPHSRETIEGGNIIIDSGTTLTYLRADLYSKLESEVMRHVDGKRAKDPHGLLRLCYDNTNGLKVPVITAHFRNADLKLLAANTFLEINAQAVCLAIVPTDDLPIFGNVAQIDYKVGYDVQNNIVSFKPVDCSK